MISAIVAIAVVAGLVLASIYGADSRDVRYGLNDPRRVRATPSDRSDHTDPTDETHETRETHEIDWADVEQLVRGWGRGHPPAARLLAGDRRGPGASGASGASAPRRDRPGPLA
jgi:hypothetical protein